MMASGCRPDVLAFFVFIVYYCVFGVYMFNHVK
jgi:hypothetical protein